MRREISAILLLVLLTCLIGCSSAEECVEGQIPGCSAPVNTCCTGNACHYEFQDQVFNCTDSECDKDEEDNDCDSVGSDCSQASQDLLDYCAKGSSDGDEESTE